jgi:hypothetical protein
MARFEVCSNKNYRESWRKIETSLVHVIDGTPEHTLRK